tara:strand:+ start:132 stop:335 length:204 start_codon:yes stop_codon:yes gene_type:complete
MAKPTTVKMITKAGACVELTLAHAQAVLQLQASQGRVDWMLDSKKFQFKDNVIKRKPSNKASKAEKE